MKKVFFPALVAAIAICAATGARATVLDFDSGLTDLTWFSGPYQGFNFGNNDPDTNDWFYNNPTGYAFDAPGNGAVGLVPVSISGDPDAYESLPVTVAGGGTFTLQSAEFSGSPFDLGGFAQVYFKLYDSNGFVGATAPMNLSDVAVGVLSTDAWASTPITAFTVVGPAKFFLMDNLTVNAPPVPEPATYALMLLGIAGVGAVVRRKRPQ